VTSVAGDEVVRRLASTAKSRITSSRHSVSRAAPRTKDSRAAESLGSPAVQARQLLNSQAIPSAGVASESCHQRLRGAFVPVNAYPPIQCISTYQWRQCGHRPAIAVSRSPRPHDGRSLRMHWRWGRRRARQSRRKMTQSGR